MYITILFINLLITLFVLYKLGRDDYVFIRKNVTTEQLFNYAFIAGLCAFVGARILYAILYAHNVLPFLVAYKQSGMSLLGAVISGTLYILLRSMAKKLPTARILDFFTIAVLFTLPLGILGTFLLSGQHLVIGGIVSVLYLIIAFFFYKVLFTRLQRSEIREGTISILFFLSFVLISLFTRIIVETRGQSISLQSEDYLYVGALCILIVLLFLHERKRGRGRAKNPQLTTG